MDVWTPKVGDENLYLEAKDRNEYDKNAVAMINDRKKLVDIFRKI